MGGLFGVASESECVTDLFFGTDYHSHLGTRRGGMAVMDGGRIRRYIHWDITNAQFRSKFEEDIKGCAATAGSAASAITRTSRSSSVRTSARTPSSPS